MSREEEVRKILNKVYDLGAERKTDIDNIAQALSSILALFKGREEIADIIFNTIYSDKLPKQEISARLECLVVADALTSLPAKEYCKIPNCPCEGKTILNHKLPAKVGKKDYPIKWYREALEFIRDCPDMRCEKCKKNITDVLNGMKPISR